MLNYIHSFHYSICSISTYYNIGSKLIHKQFTLLTSTYISSEGVLLKPPVAVCTNLSLPATTLYSIVHLAIHAQFHPCIHIPAGHWLSLTCSECPTRQAAVSMLLTCIYGLETHTK